jgi:Fur family transcriptional regulator, ferric uptake regulator
VSPDALTASADPAGPALARLRAAGHRITTARRLLLVVLAEDRAHRSADELAAAVQARAPRTNRSTIYRNLDELARLGLIDRTGIGGRPAVCHLTPADHGHLACQACGQITEIPGQLLDGLARTLRDRYGFTLSQHRFAITGRCADCQ